MLDLATSQGRAAMCASPPGSHLPTQAFADLSRTPLLPAFSLISPCPVALRGYPMPLPQDGTGAVPPPCTHQASAACSFVASLYLPCFRPLLPTFPLSAWHRIAVCALGFSTNANAMTYKILFARIEQCCALALVLRSRLLSQPALTCHWHSLEFCLQVPRVLLVSTHALITTPALMPSGNVVERTLHIAEQGARAQRCRELAAKGNLTQSNVDPPTWKA